MLDRCHRYVLCPLEQSFNPMAIQVFCFFLALELLVPLPHVCAQQRRGTLHLWRDGTTSSPALSSGRVQIFIDSWGNICDDEYFSYSEANVICHQLGYTGASNFSKALLDS